MISIAGKVRYSGIDCGQVKWKEGGLSVEEDKGIAYCIMSPKVGHPKRFKLSNNIKSLSEAKENRRKIIIALLDGTHIHLDQAKQPDNVVKLSQYLHELKAGAKNRGTRSVKIKALSPNQTSPEYKDTEHSKHTPRNATPKKSDLNSTYALSNSTPWRERTSPASANSVVRAINRNADQENRDKENEGIVRTNTTPRSDRKGLSERKTGPSSSQFLSSFDDKQKALEERKSSTPTSSLNVGFYSRGQQMVNHGLNNTFLSSSRSNFTPVKRQPGFLSDPTHLIKKPRLGENYEGWRHKNKVTLNNTSQVSLQGFSNLGNTCYMNAILQSLFGLETFASDILNFELIKKVPKQCLYKCLTHLLHVKRLSRPIMPEQKRELLKKVKNAISSSAERFSGFLQHDAHEFLNQCLDQLKEDVERVNKESRANSPKRDNSEKTPETDNATQDPFACPVTLNFEFEVLHVITCNNCNETVSKAERFYDLSLDMPRRKDSSIAKSVQDALDQFFRDEKIEYECNECHTKQSTVSHKFTKLPRILVVHLKRYSYNISALKNNKLGESINIAKFLTLGLHCTNETRPPRANDKKPNILSPTKQDKCWSSQDEHESKSLTARKRLYGIGLSSGSDALNKSRSRFKIVRKQNESDWEDEEVSRYSKDSNSLLSGRNPSTQNENEIENDFKPLTELSEDEQLAQVLEMSKEDNKMRHQDVDGETDHNTSLTFDELTTMTEEEQLAKAMELSKQENGPIILDSSSQDEGSAAEGQPESSEVGLRGGGILKGSDFVDRSADDEYNLDNLDNTPMRRVGAGRTLTLVRNRNIDNLCNTRERKYTSSPSQSSAFVDLTDASSGTEAATNPGGSKDTVFDLDSTSRSEESPEREVYPLFDKVKRSGGKCKQYSAKKGARDYSNPFRKRNNSSDHGNKGEGTSPGKAEGTPKPSNSEMATAEAACMDLEDFYNDYDKDKEDKDLAAAISASMKDQSVLDQEDEDIKRAKELSLQDFEKSFFDGVDQAIYSLSDEENEPDYANELETLNVNEEEGNHPFSYQLVSVVSHIGSSSSMGHYISDVYDFKKKSWLSYDDTEVDKTDEITVRTRRRRSGYIFFYLSKDIFDDLSHEQDFLHSRHSLPR